MCAHTHIHARTHICPFFPLLVTSPWRWRQQGTLEQCGILPKHYMALHPRSPWLESSPPWKPKISHPIRWLLIMLHHTHLLPTNAQNYFVISRGFTSDHECELITSCSILQPPTISLPLWVQTFSSAPCSQSSSIFVLPLVQEIKFHTHTQQLKL
jgi:hypothetical protein